MTMSQSYENDFFVNSRPDESISTHNEGTSFTVSVIMSSSTTQSIETEAKKIINLGIPDNESLEDAEKDMEQLTQNSLKDWDE